MVRVFLAVIFVAFAAAISSGLDGLRVVQVLVAGIGAIAIMGLGRRVQSARIARAPTEQMHDSAEAVIDAISEPLLLVDGGRVRTANMAARMLLGQHILGEDIRLAIRHPAAAERLSAGSSDGGTDLIGLGGRDQRVRMEVASLAGGRRVVHLIDRTTSHAAERARVDFVANASHELRTPLAAIIGFIETLDDDVAASDAAVRARFLEVMMKEARRMQRLIDDLISLSRIEAEKYSLPTTPVELADLIEEVAGELRDEEGEARADLHYEIDRVPAVAGDRAQLSQVVHNLIGNATKYGQDGTPVTIALRRDGSLIRLSVTDRGDGIKPEHIPRLTERFYRVDSGRSRTLGGTGLGLAIVKHIVERHRGRLEIASVLGMGTTVSVLLPTAIKAAVIETSPN